MTHSLAILPLTTTGIDQITPESLSYVFRSSSIIECYLCCRILKQQNMMKIGCPSDQYAAFWDSFLSTSSNKLSLNPCHFNCCHSPRSQLYPPSKFCKILHHTDNSVPRGHHSYALNRGMMNFLRQSHNQGLSWSTHFSVFKSGPES